MTERTMLLFLALALAAIAVGLIAASSWLRRTGKYAVIELAGAGVLMAFGGLVLRHATLQTLERFVFPTLVLASGIIWSFVVITYWLGGKRPYHCAFCGRSQRDVKTLVRAAQACICDECVESCRATIAQPRTVS